MLCLPRQLSTHVRVSQLVQAENPRTLSRLHAHSAAMLASVLLYPWTCNKGLLPNHHVITLLNRCKTQYITQQNHVTFLLTALPSPVRWQWPHAFQAFLPHVSCDISLMPTSVQFKLSCIHNLFPGQPLCHTPRTQPVTYVFSKTTTFWSTAFCYHCCCVLDYALPDYTQVQCFLWVGIVTLNVYCIILHF